jgi:hypothetical protein
MDWHHVKDWLEHASGLDMDALHVHAGVLLQIGAAIALRRPLRSLWPWLVVLGAESANEIYDYTYEVWPGAERQIQLAEGIRDLWNTMLIPSLVLILARFAPALLIGATAEPSAADPGHSSSEGG